MHGVEYVSRPHLLDRSLSLRQLLAYALGHMAGVGGYNGWRWIFIIEGLATVVLAIPSKFLIVDWPETAKFLDDEQRQLLLRRLSDDAAEARMDRLDSKARRRTFGDWKIYVGYRLPIIYSITMLIELKYLDVPRCHEHRLQRFLLHAHNLNPTRLDCCSRTGPLNPDLCCRSGRLSHLRLSKRSRSPPLWICNARHIHRNDRVHHPSSTAHGLCERPLLRYLPHRFWWLHHSTAYSGLAGQQHGRSLQAKHQRRHADWLWQLRRHHREQHLHHGPEAYLSSRIWRLTGSTMAMWYLVHGVLHRSHG